jgi:hypothetical protein
MPEVVRPSAVASESAVQPRSAMRPLTELTNTSEPAWPLVQQWIASAPHVEVLPADPAKADAALVQLQVTVRSPMGAVVHQTGGLLIDHGWLRVLGSGSKRLSRSLPAWNDGKVPTDAAGRPTLVLVADDVLGSLFAVNGGALGDDLGKVFYLAPDTLQWENLSLGYSDFLAWALSPRLGEFYRDLRWPGWQDEVTKVPGDRALSVYPFLWAEGAAIEERARKVVPLDEMYRLTMDMRQQLSR